MEPKNDKQLIDNEDVLALKSKIITSGLSVSQLVSTAWASASTFRGSDKRGGANGARIALAPQKDWQVNNPEQLAKVLKKLQSIRKDFNHGKKQVSLADLIVLGGCAAIERAASDAGHKISVPFTPGRTDASQKQTDIEAFAVLEPTSDGFRNYHGKSHVRPADELLIDRAQLLTLTAPEMTVLVGGMRALNANFDGSNSGIFSRKPGTLTNEFFVNLLSRDTVWEKAGKSDNHFEGKDRKSGKVKWTASRADLVFGSNSQLRALAEVYAEGGSDKKFVADFVAAWNKVMNLDRYDIA